MRNTFYNLAKRCRQSNVGISPQMLALFLKLERRLLPELTETSQKLPHFPGSVRVADPIRGSNPVAQDRSRFVNAIKARQLLARHKERRDIGFTLQAGQEFEAAFILARGFQLQRQAVSQELIRRIFGKERFNLLAARHRYLSESKFVPPTRPLHSHAERAAHGKE